MLSLTLQEQEFAIISLNTSRYTQDIIPCLESKFFLVVSVAMAGNNSSFKIFTVNVYF